MVFDWKQYKENWARVSDSQCMSMTGHAVLDLYEKHQLTEVAIEELGKRIDQLLRRHEDLSGNVARARESLAKVEKGFTFTQMDVAAASLEGTMSAYLKLQSSVDEFVEWLDEGIDVLKKRNHHDRAEVVEEIKHKLRELGLIEEKFEVQVDFGQKVVPK